jgi:DNA-binding MarR family transcriptional regulator
MDIEVSNTEDLPNRDDVARLAEALGPALLRLVRQFRLGIQAVGLPPAQVMLLARIAERPGIGVSELAATECIRRATISGHMREIEAAGLVERLPPDPDDRRRGGFAATPAGLRLLDDVKRRWTGWLAHRILELPDEGREALAASLPHLRDMSALSAPPAKRSGEHARVPQP